MRLGKRIFKQAWAQATLAWLAAGYIRLVTRTTRWRRVAPPAVEALAAGGGGVIFCFWHGRMLLMRAAWRGQPRRFHMLISGHSDGAMIARALRTLGLSVITGSGSHAGRSGGAAALQEMREIAARGEAVGITPDGPRGPLMRVKGGAVKVAQATGAPLVPVTGSVRRGRSLSSWDRFLLPWPGNRGVLLFGEPIAVPADARLGELESARRHLEGELIRLTEEADRLCGRPPTLPAEDSGRRPKSRRKKPRSGESQTSAKVRS